MKLITNSNFNLCFPKLSGNFGLWLLLMSFSINTYAQLHVADNTVINIQEGTVLYIADKVSTEIQQETVKIYIGQDTKITNLPTDSLVEIVYLKKESQPKKTKEILRQKGKKNKPEPPTTKKDSYTDDRQTVLSFTSRGKKPSALFYSGKTNKLALVHSGNFVVKLFPPKKANKNIIHTFFLNDKDQQIIASFAGILPKPQIHLERQITRPPPVLIKSHSEIS